MKSKLILVGGFLGAGKTTLLWEAARRLKSKGKLVGLITNDQAAELVDTKFLETSGDLVREVSGSCFCCNFNGFADAISSLAAQNDGGVILAEPVGSCTDLSATLMQPLKEQYGDSVALSPLTVLADPARLRTCLNGADSAGDYIIAKQFEEADVILINKTDLLSKAELDSLTVEAGKRWSSARMLTVSAKTGAGLDEWLDIVLAAGKAGSHLAEVDYDIYADGEAAFGWLNARFDLMAGENDLSESAAALLSGLGARFAQQNANVGHVKFLLQASDKLIIGNLTGGAETATLRELPEKSDQLSLTVNARVEMGPDELEAIVREEVARVYQKGHVQAALKCLIPGRPNPTHRYTKVIA